MIRSSDDREAGAAAVEMALLAPLLFMLIFGIISYGLAFLQLQTVRSAMREGARASAVGATAAQVQSKVLGSSLGALPTGTSLDLSKASCAGGVGSDTTVKLAWNGNGIAVSIPFVPKITLHPDVSSTFQCEVRSP